MQSRVFRGFTLIELMVTVAIVAILATIALPNYREFVAKSKRAEGKTALLKAAQLQERFYSTNNTIPIAYATSAQLPVLFGLANGAPVYSGEDPALNTGSYTLTVDGPTGTCPIASCFVLRATPNGNHAPDLLCGNLTLTSTGVRNETGTRDIQYCWN